MSDLAIIRGWPIRNKPGLNYFTIGKEKKRAVTMTLSKYLVSKKSASSGLIAAAGGVERVFRARS